MHVGYWGIAAIVIVLLSWLFYRYFAPKSWKEWTRAGLVQAFIIAFYAEMYGFPLTIYLLARVFGLDISWTEGGNLWAQLSGTEWAHLIAMTVGYAIVLVGLALIAIGCRELYRAQREVGWRPMDCTAEVPTLTHAGSARCSSLLFAGCNGQASDSLFVNSPEEHPRWSSTT